MAFIRQDRKSLRWEISVVWLQVLALAYPVIWAFCSSNPLPLMLGLRGLTRLWVGVPVLFATTVCALIMTVPRWRHPDRLLVGSGFMMAMFFGLSLYVANSGFIGMAVCSSVMYRTVPIVRRSSLL